ncbi:MAG: hypothetical protein LBV58_02795 [Acholeplasmatales bacterium]|jgi:V/A-type H+-transporting ATPase subunit I|nr:hypothetical protein [Acholeplasmatales bacterium]
MGVSKLKLIDITSNLINLDPVLVRFIELKDIHPVLANEIIDKVHGMTSFVSENPCQALLNELYELEKKYGFDIKATENKNVIDNFTEMREYMVSTRNELEEEFKKIEEKTLKARELRDAKEQVKYLQTLDVSLDALFNMKYTFIRFGRIPNDSLEKVKYFSTKPFVFNSFSVESSYTWCMYITTEDYKVDVDNIFSSLFFERTYIPSFVHGTPKDALLLLEDEIKSLETSIDDYTKEINDISSTSINKLGVIKGELLYLNRLYESKKYVVGMGDRFNINLFTEEENVSGIIASFKDLVDVEVNVNEGDSDKRIVPPSKIKGDFFSRPFKMFTEMYGVPGYNDIDPTLFVAITYTLLFGIMFGDLGQGLVLVILSLLLIFFKNSNLGKIGLRLGISSVIFGAIFGSFFGNEELLGELYQKIGIFKEGVFPFQAMHSSDNTMITLLFAVGIGIVLILSSMIFNICTLIKKKKYVEMLCSHNGISGFIFYACVIIGAAPMVLNMMLPSIFHITFNFFNIVVLIFGILVPILLIFLKEPLERIVLHEKPFFEGGVVGFIISGVFEMVEVLLGYLSNTMSFLRVGGFVLSHAGMMLVVMTLNSMMNGVVGNILVLVIGNLFVMGLEGLVVCIQGLRLEFYEMFSRYYEGDGVAFSALNE